MENILNKIQDTFKDLKFDEVKHIYTVNEKQLKYSVSGLIKKFEVPFNKEAISLLVARKEGRTQQEVLDSWEKITVEACERGTITHHFGEFYPFDRTLKPKTKLDEAIVKFWNDLPEYIVPVGMEIRMYHKEFMFAGTADILLYNKKEKTFVIADYKTNADLFKNYKGKKMTGVFSNMLDNPFNHYQLQLSFYQILLEQIGIKVSSRKIIWLKPDGEYEMYSTDDCTNILKDELKNNLCK